MLASHAVRRRFGGLWLGPLAALAFVSAKTVTAFAGALFLTPDAARLAEAPSGAAPLPSAPAAPHTTAAAAILARNPFDHETGPLDAQDPADGEPVALDLDPMHAPRCEGVTVRVITASSEPDWSLTVLSSSETPRNRLLRRGGAIGRKTVHFVGWDRVWLREGAALCQVGLHDGGGEAPKPPATSSAPAPGAAGIDPVLRKGIVRVSATEHAIDRGVVEKILENPAELLRARVVPEQEGGRVVGLRLFGVRPDSLLALLGVENGDRLGAINGFELTTPEKIFEAYARLRTADKLTLSVNRRGQPMTLDYAIR
ncbi:MAG: general secretion pathway protein GspC [Myxococcales bacterium]|nr:general secretion pathway protein GspC [Myxococcales bacterium]